MPRKLCVFLLPLLIAAQVASPARAAQKSYFQMTEVFSEDVTHFPKWNGMVDRSTKQTELPDDQCDRVQYFPCRVKDWRSFLDGLKKLKLTEVLDKVNAYGNAFPYTIDQINWSMEDYWETPYEFHAVSGDCEDYAITKYYSLRALGVTPDRLRIIIVQDFNLGGVIHAVLGVYDGKELYILDNQSTQVMPAERIYHYKPIYGINEQGWWAYYPRG